ncbi:sporulation histidine kinase inhibitor Sda [Priestia megaterium]|uniref:sporulation histidine kinase inhibitor Sda n=1 Tax=Priestia megaterium TaxID=1404 RepID=UPI0004231976|nr:sporulation histidine kinase inhibitor Sda [Priestia megaterium]AQU76939.1 sporulation protein [Priestia megaterium]MCU7766591.1 sporulation histidine kinase inhibitor Sda [Priestia megaterium]
MENLVDELLLTSYDKAIKLNLEREFILILEKEIKRRGLPLTSTLRNEMMA